MFIPWFSYLYLREMEAILFEGQAHAQLLTSEGISTLLNGRKDLFYDLPLSPEGYEQLYAHPLEKPIRLDGKPNDWEGLLDYSVTFGDTLITEGRETLTNSFQLLLGEHNDQIYALVIAEDESIVYRDEDILRLDLSDHLRITFTGQNGQIRKLVLTMEGPGVTTAYVMDEEWRYAIEGIPENRVQGSMSLTETGYIVEFRMPLAMFGSTKHFGLAVVDVKDADSRTISSITGTLPSAGREAFGLVLLKSPEVLKIIEGLGYSGANIQVIDAQSRVRAEVGSYRASQPESVQDDSWSNKTLARVRRSFESIYSLVEVRFAGSPKQTEHVVKEALQGKPSFQRIYIPDEGEVIVAAHPIIAEGEIMGTVVIKQNTDRILQLRREALERIISLSVLSLLIFVILIFAFSVHLAGRIRKLGAEATNAIDIHGRLQTNQLKAETEAGDEIGDLARSISNMLAKLHQHNQFLETMPRTLRHEINNPLNTLSTSLQNLENETSEVARAKYLESAKRGVHRIGMIVQNLADSASLEEALESEEFEIVNLHMLVKNYMANSQTTHPDRNFEYRGTARPVLARVSDYRIEQLLDKLIDNAIDFSEAGSTVIIGLTTDAQNLTIFVTNSGPCIPNDMLDNIFDSMVSVRASNPDNRLHFGIGLYVVRVIAEHHGGSVTASNLLNGNGVTLRVSLPLQATVSEHAYAAG